jgi:hypothetical protein
MDKTRQSKLRFPILLGLSLVAGLAAAVLAWWPGSTQPASADFPHAGVDLSIGVGSTCDSTAGPMKCTLQPGATFTMDFKVNALPAEFGYGGYDASIDYTGVTVKEASLVQTGAGVWPGCVFNAFDFTQPGHIAAACAFGIGAQPATYTGVMMHVDFNCVASGTVTLLQGEGASDLVDENLVPHGEASANEVLTINCGAAPPPSPTPCDGPCPTATPTNTQPPPTNTPIPPTATPVPPTTVAPTSVPTTTQPTPTQGAAPTVTALPVLAKTGSGGLGPPVDNDTAALWLAAVSLLSLAAASLTALKWRLARSR